MVSSLNWKSVRVIELYYATFNSHNQLSYSSPFQYWQGQKHSFIYDKVFLPDASQEDVFVEISQLVQSALDGYKVIYMLSCQLFFSINVKDK